MNQHSNAPLISVLKEALSREEKKIEQAEAEIIKLRFELLDLGVELPNDGPCRGELIMSDFETHPVKTGKRLKALQEFFDDVCKRCFPSMNDLDGCDFQELAHKHGLLVEVPYDPAMHGEVDGADPGDIIYVRAP